MGVRRWTLLMVALAGCLRETSYVCRDDGDCGGGRCEANGACSFTPDGIDARRGPDADPTRDQDGDEVPDVLDNCPGLANPTQHDEDGDELGDRCDNCPHVANVDQLDILELIDGAQADGVGDACDPAPAAPGNRLLFFDAFDDPAPSDWQATPQGTWAIRDDVLRVEATDAVTIFSHPLSSSGTDGPVVVQTAMHVLTQGSGAGNSFSGGGSVARFAPSGATGVSCVAGRNSSATVTARLLDLPLGVARATATLDAEPVLVGRTFDVTFAAGAGILALDTCTVTGPADSAAASAMAEGEPGTDIGLLASRITADFAYIAVYGE
jgi:hypothetical protein